MRESPWTVWPHTHVQTCTHMHARTNTRAHTILPSSPPTPKPGLLPRFALRKGSYSEGPVTNKVLLLFNVFI